MNKTNPKSSNISKITSTHWGAFSVSSDGKMITSVSSFDEDTEPSDIFRIVPKAVHHQSRVARPSVRASWLKGQRGARHETTPECFTEVPWDEALDLAAQEVGRVRNEHGNGAIFGGSYGWASAGRFNHAQSQLKRFLNCAGGFVSGYGSYSAGTSYVMIPHIFGVEHQDFTWNWQNTWSDIIDHTQTLVAFGGINPKNSQVNAGGIGNHKTGARLTQLLANGAEIHTISPMASDGPSGGTWTSIIPGTDVALMLGLAFVLETEDLVDRDFLTRCTQGYDILRGYVLGVEDDVIKTPEWASGLCGVPAEVIRKLARQMAGSRTMITVAWALQRAQHGEQTYWMASALAAMLGQIGLPGGGIGFGYGAVAGIGTDVKPLSGCTFPQGHNPVDDLIPVSRISDMLLNPGGAYQFNGMDRTYPDIKLIYWAGGNPFHHHQDLHRLIKAWDTPETIIVNEPWWTATAQRADIIFPATTSFEREDIGRDKSDNYLFYMPQLIEPVGEARDDHIIFRDLAERLGVGEHFTEGRDSQSWIRHLYSQFEESCRENSVTVPSLDELRQKNWVKLDVEHARAASPLVKFRAAPEKYPLSTPSGRIEIFSSTIAGFDYGRVRGHPVWNAPTEGLGGELAEKFPLHLLSPQPADKLHSQFESALADAENARPMRVLVHRQAAIARNIRDGDLIEVFNERGKCKGRAQISTEIHQDVVSLPTGAWLDLDSQECDKHGNPNVLTSDIGTSLLGQGSAAHTTLVDIRPIRL